MEVGDHILAFLGISATIKLAGSLLARGSKSKKVEYVGELSRLSLFPCKSMRGVDIKSGLCTQEGLRHPSHNAYDRCLLVIKNNQFMSSKMIPKMATVRTELKGTNKIVLNGEGVKPLEVILERIDSLPVVTARVLGENVEGQDCGEKAAEWLSSYLQTPGLRLIFGAPGLKKRRLIDRGDKWTRESKLGDEVTYNNTHPFMIMSESGLEDFNSRLGETLSMNRFRPNMVVSGCVPFDEDEWAEIWIGDLRFSNLKPCQRCPCTTIDPDKGVKHEKNEPLATLDKYRDICPDFPKRGIFGACLVLVSAEGTIREGDPIYVIRKSNENGRLW